MSKIIIFFAFITLAFFSPVLFTTTYHLPIGSDFVHFNYPNDVFAARSLQSGELPLWNPYVSAGQPYAADPNIGFFYPFRLLLTSSYFDYRMMTYLLIFHYFLAGLFTYALAKDLGASRFGSITAGVGFMFSGFLISQMDHINIIFSSVWLPLIFLFFRRAVLESKVPYALLAGLVLSLSVLGGHQQFTLFSVYWCAIWLAVLLAHTRGKKFFFKIGLFLGMIAVSVGASSIQILPTVEFFQYTQRNALTLVQASLYNTILTDWILLLFPHYLGAYARQADFLSTVMINEFYMYAGVITLFSAFVGSYVWKSWEKRFFLLMILLSVIFSAGHITPLYQLALDIIPGMKYVRVPGRFVFWLNLSLPILSAFGVDWILQQMASANKRLSRDAILICATGAILGISFFLFFFKNAPPEIPPEIISLRLLNNLMLSALLLGLTLFLFFQKRWPRNHLFRQFFLLSLLLVDLFAAQWPRHFTTRNVLDVFEHPEIVTFLDQNAGFDRISFVKEPYNKEKWPPLGTLLYGYYQDRGLPWNPFDLEAYARYRKAVDLGGRFYSFLGTRFLIADGSKSVPEQWVLKLSANGLNVYENSQVMPRAFMVYQSIVETNPEKALEMIRNEEFDPLTTVLLTSGEPFSAPVGANQVTITSITNNSMSIHAESDQPGYLVVSDVLYPGWRVFVNEQAQEMLRANYAFRAVFLPAGQSTVYFEFRPPLFTVGLAITLLTWFIFLGMGLLLLFDYGCARFNLKPGILRKLAPSSLPFAHVRRGFFTGQFCSKRQQLRRKKEAPG